jgi:integrase
VWRTESITGSRTDASRRARELRADARRLAEAGGRDDTVSAYLTGEWLPAVSKVSKRRRPLAPTTAAKYTAAVERVASSHLGRMKLTDVRPRHVERFRDELMAPGTLAPQTVGDVLRVLSQALRRAASRGLIDRNPADSSVVDRPGADPRPIPTIDGTLAQTILAAVRGVDPWDVAAHLALGASLRREEVLGLEWSDIDLDEGRLSVARTLTWAGGELHWGPPKSAAGERTILLPGFVVDALRRHWAAQMDRRVDLGEAWWPERQLVVDRGDGRPWSPPSFSKSWSRFAARQGFGDVTFLGLRHGAATLMLAAGVPDPVAVAVMGHADTRILRRYQEVVDELKREAASRMDAMLGGMKQE